MRVAGLVLTSLLALPGLAAAKPLDTPREKPAVVTADRRDADAPVGTVHVVVDTKPGPNPIWTVLLSAAAALGGALVGYLSTRASSRATIIQKTNELEIESLDRRLSEFVGPFMQLSEENRTLAQELKRSHDASADFRTLTALLTRGWRDGLSKGEANLLAAVVSNGVELRRLLMEKGSAMVSPQLIPYFSRASTHFRFLELAYAGSLDEDPDRYSAYVYPRELDDIMETERQRLETRRELLRSRPHEAHSRMPDLQTKVTSAPAKSG